MDEKVIFTGVGALVVGVIVGMVAGGSAPDLTEIRSAVAEAVAPASEESAAMSERLGTLEESLAGLGDRLGGIETQLSEAPDPAAGVAPLQEQVGALQSAVREGLAAAAEGQEGLQTALSELGSGLGALSGSLETMGSAASATSTAGATARAGGAAAASEVSRNAPDEGEESAATTPEAPEAAPEPEPAAEAMPDADPAPETGNEYSVGQTANFGDGSVRVFVSMVDTGTGTARLMMNGALVTLPTGAKRIVEGGAEPCLVRLAGVNDAGAQLSAACGADIPDPEGVGMGETAMLGDGAARVFVSGVSGDSLVARVAVNGITPQQVSVGESISVGEDGCAVTVEDIDRGHVTFAYACQD